MLFQDRQRRLLPAAAEVSVEARHEEVRKVLSSAALEKCARLKDLLSYLAERSVAAPDSAIPEQEIGVAVFGRKDYDASRDNLVRVQATQLRKKLEQYFATEGIDDPVRIELPRGSYVLRFQHRTPPRLLNPRVPARWQIAGLAVAAAALLVAAGWVARGWTANVRVKQPTVHRLWSQFFDPGLTTHLVLADANLTALDDALKQTLGLRQYGRANVLQKLVQDRVTDPEFRVLLERLASKHFVTLPDAAAARKIEALGLLPGTHTRFGYARGFQIDHLMADNAILLGNKRANPWVELFDEQLRFRYAFDNEKIAARFEDTQEHRVYPTVWDRESHCQVAILPNLRQTGSVLIIAGGDQSAAEAGSEFLTSERWVAELARRLGVSAGQRFPYFEAFLKTETLSSTNPSFRILFVRRVQ